MRICLVGGIFDRPEDYRERHSLTPETILAEGLRRHGVEVEECGHRSFRPALGYDLIHVHHLAQGTLRALSAGVSTPIVFTGHAGPIICGYDRSLSRRLAFRYAVERSAAFVALSQWEALCVRRRLPRQRHAVVIPNGIPSDIFKVAPHTQSAGPAVLRLLYVGQLVELKGVDTLLAATAVLARRQAVRLALVYQNAAGESQLRRLAARLGIGGCVRFVGMRGAQELAQIYNDADIVVLPSRAEALPSVLTEAMLCGKPVVASRVGGIPEQAGGYGELFAAGDADGLVGALERMQQRLAAGQIDANQVHAYAAGKFSVTGMIDGHLRLYSQVAGCAPTARRRPGALADKVVKHAVRIRFGR